MRKANPALSFRLQKFKMDGSSDVQAPLYSILSVEETVKLIENVTKQLSQGCYVYIQPSIISLSSSLKRHGPSLELQHSSHLDRLQLVLRSSCRDQNLDLVSRVHLLEMIELRTFNWAPTQQVTNYYKTKLGQIKGETLGGPQQHSPSAEGHARPASSGSHLHSSSAGGQVNSSKSGLSHLLMNIPNRPATSNRFYSDRSLTFNHQQPPVKQKLSVVNTGVSRENATNSGEHSIEENIVPVDDNGKRTITVNTKSGNIVLTSVSTDLLHSVKRILQEELSDELLSVSGTSSSSSSRSFNKPELVYSRPELLELASSPLCRMPPPDWLSILSEIPSIVKSKPVENYHFVNE